MSLSANRENSNTEIILTNLLQRTSMQTQDFDYFITTFDIKDKGLLQNKSSLVSNNFAFYFQKSDSMNISNEDKAKINSLNELIDKWIKVISDVYPGITSENRNQKLSEYIVNKEIFLKNKKWKNLIIGLENVAREYEGVSRSG